MTDDALKLRPMSFEGIPYEDDWLVISRGLVVGRILKQGGVPMGKPDWWWGVNFDQRPQGGDGKGTGRDLDDCKRQFKVAWDRLRAGLSEADVEAATRSQDEADRRARGVA
jgi:hypothetical protein